MLSHWLKSKTKAKRLQKHIDFVGLPASGKTTVYRALIESNFQNTSGYKVVTLQSDVPKYRKYPVLLFIFFIKLPDVLFVLYFFMRYTRYSLLNLYRLRSILKLILQTDYELRTQTFDFYCNNGVLHHLIDIEFGEKNTTLAINKFIRYFKDYYDALVLIDMSKAELASRMSQRQTQDKKLAKYFSDTVFKNNWLEYTYEQYKILRNILINRNKPLLVLSAGDLVEEKVQSLQHFLQSNYPKL